MKTDDLIAAIAADAATSPKRLRPAFYAAIGLSVFAAGVVFEALLGARPDIAYAIGTMRFPFKFVVTIAFALAAGSLAARLARPGSDPAPARIALAGAAALLAVAVAVELVAVPRELWATRLVGKNWAICLVNVPVLSAIPLAVILTALRRGAPGSPARLGAAAGLLAGALGATFYAAHCGDDSPLFVATWYTLGVGLVTLAGAAIGSRLLRW